MPGKPDQPDLQELRQRIEHLWAAYLDPSASERERRRIGWEIDATFDRIRHTAAWAEVFLATDIISEDER